MLRLCGNDTTIDQVRAITVRQPWAHVIVTGEKPVENRTWQPSWRGVLLIHAAQTRRGVRNDPKADTYVYGAIVAVCFVHDWLPVEDIRSRRADPYWCRLAECAYTNGPFCAVLTRVRRLTRPIECTGQQKLWRPDPRIVRAVAKQVTT